MLDLLFLGGEVLDGAGNEPIRMSVGVDGDTIREIRCNPKKVHATRKIDVSGLVVSPGFIDMHSHSGLVLLHDSAHEAKVRQGVTTEVIGVDGNSYAPFRRNEDLRDFVRLNAGLDGKPDVKYDWDSVASYLLRFDGAATVNVALLMGNSPIRICAVGWSADTPSRRQLGDMKALIREGMEEGAFGISTGLDYAPGSHASTDELIALAAEAARHGGIYHTHVRYQLGDRYLDPFREALEIGHRSSCAVHLTHLYRRPHYPGGSAPLLHLVDQARRDDLDVTFDTYPYEWSSTRLMHLLPLWVQEGRPDEIKARLADPAMRAKIREGVAARGSAYGGEDVWNHVRLGYFFNSGNRDLEGRTLGEIIADRGGDAADVMIDLLLSEDLGVNEVAPGPHGPSIAAFLAHPLSMVGSDSVFLGDLPSPRTYGTFPRVLGEFVREERVLGLPEAVRKMTSYPAFRLGLHKRGLIRDGLKADLVAFDPDRVRARATYQDPRQYPDGIQYVVVNGELVVDDGQVTERRPGRALRRGRD